MRFYTQQHSFYCGIDLHARTMYLCILNQAGAVVLHRNMKRMHSTPRELSLGSAISVASTTPAILSHVLPESTGFDWTLAPLRQNDKGFRFVLCPSREPESNWP